MCRAAALTTPSAMPAPIRDATSTAGRELTRRPWGRAWGRILLGLLAAALLLVAGGRLAGLVPAFAAWMAGLGAWGAVAFVLGYALACVAVVPASLLTLAAGAVFGLGRGVALVTAGALLGAASAFLLARYAVRGAVERRLAGNPRLAAVDRAVATDGRRIVFLLRLSPAVPFSALNYALGATRLSFADYMLGSLGILPGTVLYVYYGTVAGTIAAAAGGTATRSPAEYVLLGVGLLATIGATYLITRAARRALAAASPGVVAAAGGDAAAAGDAATAHPDPTERHA